jgi:hypothetical protein
MKQETIQKEQAALMRTYTFTYRIIDVKGANLADGARITGYMFNTERGTVRITYTASHVAAVFCRVVNVAPREFAVCYASLSGLERKQLATVMYRYVPRAALLAALKPWRWGFRAILAWLFSSLSHLPSPTRKDAPGKVQT